MKITKSVRAARDVKCSYEVVLKDGDMYTKEDGNNDIAYIRRPIIKTVGSIDEASKLVRQFIEGAAIGASQFTGGIVLQDAVPVFVVSYNGKITPFHEYIDRWGTGIIENSRVLKGLDYKAEDFVQNAIDDGIEASEDREWFVVDTPLDNRSDEWWAEEEKKRLARELADEEDAYDLEHDEGIYSCDAVQASSTRDRISDLEKRIAELEEGLKYARATGADDDVIIDYQLELDELRDELNFAWQDDEAEWNYALEQQEFNPDGSLKGYSDYDNTYASTNVTASDKLLNNKKIQVGMQWNRDWHCIEVKSISPDRKTCQITEDWISEDSGKEMHKEFTFNISEDPQHGEFIWEPKNEEYAFNPNEEDGYNWWARIYAVGADNYPYDEPETDEEEAPEEGEYDFPTHYVLYNKYSDATFGDFKTYEEADVYRQAAEMDPNEWHVVETDY